METQDNANYKRSVREICEKEKFTKSLGDYLREYCEISSIQGLAYITKKSTLFERLWWIIVFTICIGGCSFMVYQIFDKWITTPVLISLATRETPIYEVPFPAVTICPESKISTKCLNYSKILIARKHGELQGTTFQENKYYDYMSFLCKSSNHGGAMGLANRSISELFNESSPEVYNDVYPSDFTVSDYSQFLYDCASVKIEDSKCQWMGVNLPCNKLMVPIMTDEGLCYTFNMFDERQIYSKVNQMQYFQEERKKPDWNPDWGYPDDISEQHIYPRRAYLNGAKNAFVAIFFTRKDQLSYACTQFSIQGIRVSMHMPSRIPRPSQAFFSVGLNRLTTAAITPTMTTVTKSIEHYDPHKRNCYFSKERKLKYFTIYSQGNCNLECWTNFTIQMCGCVSIFMPRDTTTRICSLSKRYCLEEARVLYPQVCLAEMLSTRDKNGKFANSTSSNCDCLPICSDITYNAELASAEWDFSNPDEAAFDSQRDYINEYYASAVKIFFKEKYFLPTQKDELYGTIDVIADCGGILGLFIGFSLFSVGEILYFLSIRIVENFRQHGYWAGPRMEVY